MLGRKRGRSRLSRCVACRFRESAGHRPQTWAGERASASGGKSCAGVYLVPAEVGQSWRCPSHGYHLGPRVVATWSPLPGWDCIKRLRENTPERAGLRSAHPVSRLQPWIGRRESAGLFARSSVVHWRNGLSAGGKRIRTVGSAMRSHRRQRCHSVTPPDTGSERRFLWPPLDNSIGMPRLTGKSMPWRCASG